MSYIERPEEFTSKWTETARYEFIKKHKTIDKTVQLSNIDNWFPNQQDYLAKKCCNTCKFFVNGHLQKNTGWCLDFVTNDIYSEYIENSDTFYCSYHKFRV